MKLTKQQVKQWFIDIEEDMCGNANDAAEVHALRDLALSALSQTAPSAQEGAWDALARIRRMPHAQECHRNGNTERVCTCHCVVAEAALCALSATPSASALGEWRPMSEAPKDGSYFLLSASIRGVDMAFRAFCWAEDCWAYRDEHGTRLLNPDFYTFNGWMPAPSADTAGKGE